MFDYNLLFLIVSRSKTVRASKHILSKIIAKVSQRIVKDKVCLKSIVYTEQYSHFDLFCIISVTVMNIDRHHCQFLS